MRNSVVLPQPLGPQQRDELAFVEIENWHHRARPTGSADREFSSLAENTFLTFLIVPKAMRNGSISG